MNNSSPYRHAWSLLLLIFCLSLPVKLIAAHNMVWDMDIVPVVAHGQAWLAGGAFPVYGTLSSVAAYNMPFLVWLHLPALIITDDARLAMLMTLLVFNAVGTLYCYLAGAALFQPRAGIIAAALFTFSETSVSSSYTAWAQLLLPVFFIVVFYHLWQWRIQAQGRHLAVAGIVATAAFMTHFAAIMLFPAMLLFALVSRARWQWRSFLLGVGGCLLLLAPYLFFQIDRDFVDLRAFLTRKSPIPAAVLAQYEQTIGQQLAVVAPETASTHSVIPPENMPPPLPETASASPTLPERVLTFGLSLPRQYWDALRMFSISETPALNQTFPAISSFTTAVSFLMLGVFLGVSGWAILHFGRDVARLPKVTPVIIRTAYRSQRSRQRSPAHVTRSNDAQTQQATLNERLIIKTPAGRLVLLVIFMLTFITGLIVTRAAPSEQGSYYTGLFSLQWLVVAYGLAWLSHLTFAAEADNPLAAPVLPSEQRRHGRTHQQPSGKNSTVVILIVLLVLTLYLWCLGADRVLRITQHHDMVYSRYNVWLYRHIEAVTDYIADDWQNSDNPVIQYDIVPEMANLWWVLPWHNVDTLYRMGVSYDYLLLTKHGIINNNQNADGMAENPDYIIVYTPGLPRYTTKDYEIKQFGAIFVLEPRPS
jgi:hypothetical protein